MQPTIFDYSNLRGAMRSAGSHFLDAGSMRFFRSRLGYGPIQTKDRRATFFVTSEQFSDHRGTVGARLYTVRVWHGATSVGKIGEFQQFKSGATAKRALLRAVANYEQNAPTDIREWCETFEKVKRNAVTGEPTEASAAQ